VGVHGSFPDRPGDRMATFIIDIVTDYYFWGAMGCIIGPLIYLPRLSRDYPGSFPLYIVVMVAGVYGGLLGSRILYVLITMPRLFLYKPFMALAFWHGGLAWQGGFPLGFFVIFLVTKIARKPFWEMAGSLAPPFAITHAVTRVGCLIRGCCHGRPTDVPWAIFSKELGTWVHPTQVYSIMGELLTCLILHHFWREKKNRKYLLPGYGMLFATHRFFQEFFRGTPPGPELIEGLRVFQAICILIFAFSLCVFVLLRDRRKGLLFAPAIAILTALLFVFFHPPSQARLEKAREGANLFLVATRPLFLEQLSSWRETRESQGFQVVVRAWQPAPEAEVIKKWIREQARAAGGTASYILLVGDCAAPGEIQGSWHIPSLSITFPGDRKNGDFISDALYGDLDDDGLPDVPVGRYPTRNGSTLQGMFRKTLAFEKQDLSPRWFRTVIWSGAKGYHPEMYKITTTLSREGLPKWLDVFLISGNVDSAFSAFPPDQPGIFLEETASPAFLSLIVSHGSFRSVTPTQFEGKEIFLSNEHINAFRSEKSLGPLFMVGCDSGKFNVPDTEDISLAEAFQRHPGGPGSVIAASGPTSPLTNYFFATGMIRAMEDHPERVGDLLLNIQRRLGKKGKRTLAEMAKADPLAMHILPAVPEGEKSHLYIPGLVLSESLEYNLLGDPSSPLRQPQPMECVVKRENGSIAASGKTPEAGGELYIQLIRPDQKKDQLKPFPDKKSREERFRKVNAPPELLKQKRITGETWEIRFRAPKDYDLQKDFLRFLFLGKEESFYYIYTAKWSP